MISRNVQNKPFLDIYEFPVNSDTNCSVSDNKCGSRMNQTLIVSDTDNKCGSRMYQELMVSRNVQIIGHLWIYCNFGWIWDVSDNECFRDWDIIWIRYESFSDWHECGSKMNSDRTESRMYQIIDDF